VNIRRLPAALAQQIFQGRQQRLGRPLTLGHLPFKEVVRFSVFDRTEGDASLAAAAFDG
jgi:hypothetical protein